jgi:hypothetical protein
MIEQLEISAPNGASSEMSVDADLGALKSRRRLLLSVTTMRVDEFDTDDASAALERWDMTRSVDLSIKCLQMMPGDGCVYQWTI